MVFSAVRLVCLLVNLVSKAGTVYAICLALPTGEIRIASLGRSAALAAGRVHSVELLGSDEKLTWSQAANALGVQCPRSLPGPACHHA